MGHILWRKQYSDFKEYYVSPYSSYKGCIPIRSYDCINIAIVFDLNIGILLCSWSDQTVLSPKKILNVDLSLLKCTEFFHGFQKIRTCCFKF